jgi:hypothetical protein
METSAQCRQQCVHSEYIDNTVAKWIANYWISQWNNLGLAAASGRWMVSKPAFGGIPLSSTLWNLLSSLMAKNISLVESRNWLSSLIVKKISVVDELTQFPDGEEYLSCRHRGTYSFPWCRRIYLSSTSRNWFSSLMAKNISLVDIEELTQFSDGEEYLSRRHRGTGSVPWCRRHDDEDWDVPPTAGLLAIQAPDAATSPRLFN